MYIHIFENIIKKGRISVQNCFIQYRFIDGFIQQVL